MVCLVQSLFDADGEVCEEPIVRAHACTKALLFDGLFMYVRCTFLCFLGSTSITTIMYYDNNFTTSLSIRRFIPVVGVGTYPFANQYDIFTFRIAIVILL